MKETCESVCECGRPRKHKREDHYQIFDGREVLVVPFTPAKPPTKCEGCWHGDDEHRPDADASPCLVKGCQCPSFVTKETP